MNKNITNNSFYKIALNGSETIVTRKFPIQQVREQTPTNQDQKPRKRGNKYDITRCWTQNTRLISLTTKPKIRNSLGQRGTKTKEFKKVVYQVRTI